MNRKLKRTFCLLLALSTLAGMMSLTAAAHAAEQPHDHGKTTAEATLAVPSAVFPRLGVASNALFNSPALIDHFFLPAAGAHIVMLASEAIEAAEAQSAPTAPTAPTAPAAAAAPAAVQKEPERVLIGSFKAYAYCPCKKCCGKWAKGITATGTTATQGRTISVDPRVIPLGSTVYINGHAYVAEDTGSGIKGNKIDIFFNSHAEALRFGVRTVEVYR